MPASLIRAPSLTPAGTFTWIVRLRRVAPTPPQVGHGVSISRPVPRHCGHVCAIENSPWLTATWPDPRHVGQVTGWVPGAAPLPWHVVHGAGPVRVTGTVTPAIASSNDRVTSVSRSAPRLGRARRRDPPPNIPPSRSSRFTSAASTRTPPGYPPNPPPGPPFGNPPPKPAAPISRARS